LEEIVTLSLEQENNKSKQTVSETPEIVHTEIIFHATSFVENFQGFMQVKKNL
jgi:hypothetical protein